MDGFVENTNAYSGSKAPWKSGLVLAKAELKLYFAILLYMGIAQCPDSRMYWESNPPNGDTWVKGLISRARFEEITKNLHWYDTFGILAENRVRLNQRDGLA